MSVKKVKISQLKQEGKEYIKQQRLKAQSQQKQTNPESTIESENEVNSPTPMAEIQQNSNQQMQVQDSQIRPNNPMPVIESQSNSNNPVPVVESQSNPNNPMHVVASQSISNHPMPVAEIQQNQTNPTKVGESQQNPINSPQVVENQNNQIPKVIRKSIPGNSMPVVVSKSNPTNSQPVVGNQLTLNIQLPFGENQPGVYSQIPVVENISYDQDYLGVVASEMSNISMEVEEKSIENDQIQEDDQSTANMEMSSVWDDVPELDLKKPVKESISGKEKLLYEKDIHDLNAAGSAIYKIPVFFSHQSLAMLGPSDLSSLTQQQQFIIRMFKEIKMVLFFPRTLPHTNQLAGTKLDNIRTLIKASFGTAAVLLEEHVSTSGEPFNAFSHFEPAMAYHNGHPLLLVIQDSMTSKASGVWGGVGSAVPFSPVIWNSESTTVDEFFESLLWKEALFNWASQVRNIYNSQNGQQI